MTSAFFEWLDRRTAFRTLIGALLLEEIPGGARWRYVWGSTLVFVFSLQLLTGILLMTAYSPSDTSAWASVHFIQYQMDFGWLIRGLHHFGSQTMMVLIALHMLQVVIAGAQLPPREVNWWLGLALFGLTFGLSLTGYLLPWDQKGYWATRVATNIMGSAPGAGSFIRTMMVGGAEYGNHTLTRFYALHVAILPLTLIVLMVAHVALFRKHGVTTRPNVVGEEMFWPGQAFRDLVACLLIFGVMVGLILYGHGSSIDRPEDEQPAGLYEDWAHAGEKGLGANLDAPADPSRPYDARPEWYFLFLFELLKFFHGEQEIIGTFVIPNGAMVVLFLLPLLGYGAMRKFGHFVGVLVMFALVGGAAVLTAMAVIDDSPRLLEMVGDHNKQKLENAEVFQKSVEKAEKLAHRAVNLAMAGVPEDGARKLLRNDPLTRGAEAFKTSCASCHAFTPRPDEKDRLEAFPRDANRKASDLGNWGTKAWVRGLLHDPNDPKYFGGMPQLTGMKNWKKKILAGREKLRKKEPGQADEKIAAQEAEFDQIAAWLAEQALPERQRDKPLAEKAGPLFEDRCGSCHAVGKLGGDTAPNLTDYGSADWLRGMILAPAHKTRYGPYYEDPAKLHGLMPAFYNPESPGAEQGLRERNPGLPDGLMMQLSDTDREAIIRYLQRDYRVVFGGQPIAAAPK